MSFVHEVPDRLRQNRVLLGSAGAVFLLALLLLVPDIGAGYRGRDEAEYAGVAHGMNTTGDYLVPRLFGRLYADKPPLSEWLTAASFAILGEREASGRLPHILLAAGSAVLLLALGRRLLDGRRAVLASILFSSSLLFVVYGRLLLTDSDLLFFTLASILGFLRILEGPPAAWAVPAAGAALALALLAKGPVALLAPGFFLAGYLAGGGRPPARCLAGCVLALMVAVVLAVPWFALAARATAGESLRSFLLRENVGRFASPMEGHRGPGIYFLLVVWLGFFPWSGLLFSIFRRESVLPRPARWGLLFWAGGMVLFFSLSATKLPHYILPALPAVAILAAGLPLPAPAAQLRAASLAMAATAALLFVAVVVAIRAAGEPAAFRLLLPFGAAALLSLATPLCAGAKRMRRYLPIMPILASAAIAVETPYALDPLLSTRRLGLAARSRRLPGEPQGGLDIREAALTYYAGAAPTLFWKNARDLARGAASSPTRSVLVWMDSADIVLLIRDHRLRVEILEEGRNLADPRVRDLLALCRVRPRATRAGPLTMDSLSKESP